VIYAEITSQLKEVAMSAYLILSSVFAYPLMVGLLVLVGWFVVDETWYLDDGHGR